MPKGAKAQSQAKETIPPTANPQTQRKKPTILRNGNAQKSSVVAPVSAPLNGPPPLFGSWTGKVPLTLLNEYCQKQRWERPSIEAHKIKSGAQAGFTAVVHLKRKNPKDAGEIENVTMRVPVDGPGQEPTPGVQIDRPSALEARHFGATFALFRVGNHLNLKMTLPPACRDYWAALEKYKSSCAPSKNWLFEANPFEASQKRAAQIAATQARQQAASEPSSNHPSGRNTPIDNSDTWPEVKMSLELREKLQKYIAEHMHHFSDTENDGETKSVLLESMHDPEEEARINKHAVNLGFKQAKVDAALNFVKKSRQSVTKNAVAQSLAVMSMQDATLNYLKIIVPEVDLPPAFKQSRPDMNVRVGKIGSLSAQWRAAELSKDFGFPITAMETSVLEAKDSDLHALAAVLSKLIGRNCKIPLERDQDLDSEISAIQSVYEAQVDQARRSIDIRIPLKTPLWLRVMSTDDSLIVLIKSRHLPAYQILHLSLEVNGHLETMNPGGQAVSLSGCIADAYDFLSERAQQLIDDPPESSTMMACFEDKQDSASDSPGLPIRPVASRRRKQVFASSGRPPDGTAESLKLVHEDMQRTSKYKDLLSSRERLPASKMRDAITESISCNRVTFISGATGSGKTTQSPQFVLDQALRMGDTACNMVVTQPRRLAAIGVAERVSAERGENLGEGLVGYQIRGDRRASSRCRLLFMTTGVLLRRMMSQPDLDGISHVFVDEVHERSIDSDFLLLELRELLKRNDRIKIIMMSATPDPALLDYFSQSARLNIPGVSYPVKDIHLEEILSQTRYRAPSTKASRTYSAQETAEMQQSFAKAGVQDPDILATLLMLTRADSQDPSLVAAAVETFIMRPGASPCGILIFTTGVAEINHILGALREAGLQKQATLLPLHAGLSSADQARVFQPCHNRFKIVVSTNIAETSITIDDIEYVIDTGRVKEIRWDEAACVSKLTEVWTSQAAAKQRRGRAGRTRPGTCLKLYSQYAEERIMPANSTPEMLRTPLEQVVLSILVSKKEAHVAEYLGRALSPPSVSAVTSAIQALRQLQAIRLDHNGGASATALGRFMAALPMELRLSKLLVLSTIFRCITPAIIIAACLSGKPLFLAPMDRREEARERQAIFCTDVSDSLAEYNAYTAIEQCENRRAMAAFAEHHYISMSAYLDARQAVVEYTNVLQSSGCIPDNLHISDLNENSQDQRLLKAMIAASFTVVRAKLPAARYDDSIGGTIRRETVAKEVKFYDHTGRVFLHPSSSLFSENRLRSGFVSYFSKQVTSKPFIRQVSEGPLLAVIMFAPSLVAIPKGVAIKLDHEDAQDVRIRAWSRTAASITALKQIFEQRLTEAFDEPQTLIAPDTQNLIRHLITMITL